MDLIRVICGPTAAGKSSIAMRLANEHRITIVSADSRQIYRGFDVGTAKPTGEERARVPHCGIDIVEPTERYSASAWAGAALGWITEAFAAGRIPLVVGGTGFYLRALFEPLFEEPVLPDERRRRLAAALGALDTAALRRWCAALDPERAHLGRAQLLRAIEVACLTGERLSTLHRTSVRAARFTPRYLIVDPGKALGERIERRVEEMLANGWENEVRALAATIPPDAPAWNATGYRAIRALVAGELRREAAVARVVIDTRQYAKRQRTWFRHQIAAEDRAVRVDPTGPDAVDVVRAWWHAHGDSDS
jgi:tRNA dimethylallyltransferase